MPGDPAADGSCIMMRYTYERVGRSEVLRRAADENPRRARARGIAEGYRRAYE
jgi:hypothetical protein